MLFACNGFVFARSSDNAVSSMGLSKLDSG
jgi:hypothetical protein